MHARPNLLQTSPPYHMYSTHMLVQTLPPPPPHAHFVCLLCNRLQMWCWGGEVFVCHLLGRLRVHPSEGDAVSSDRGGPGLRWWGWGWGERVTAYTHLEALQVSRAWQPERWDASTWPEQHSMESMQQSGLENKALAYTHIYTHTYTHKSRR